MSAPALTKTQRSPSPLTASAAVVRDGIFFARAASQFGQLQFHCGSPPPAALPRAMIRMMRCGKCMSHSVAVAHALWTGLPSDGRPLSVVPQVRRHLGSQGNHREVGPLPRLHGDSLLRASSSRELNLAFFSLYGASFGREIQTCQGKIRSPLGPDSCSAERTYAPLSVHRHTGSQEE